jgi:UDP-N-acetylmuramoyl-tripeptide--D-alanyl-D-alanine ligase
MDWKKIHARLHAPGQVQIDSRKVQEGDLFFTIKGDRFNSNDFVKDVLDRNPAWLIADEDRGVKDERLIIVDNALEALQDFARYHRNMLTIPVIGLTGSNGKTTSKELFHSVLSQKYRVRSTIGNLNNHIGVPLSVLSIRQDDEIAVIEMGANAQKEIAFLSSISMPDIGYITNFGLAHLEGFGGPEGVIKGKSELYDYLRSNKKEAIVFSDDKRQLEKSEGIKRTLFGTGLPSPFGFQAADELPFFTINYEGEVFSTQLSGAYNYSNVAAAISMGVLFNIDRAAIKRGIESYEPSNNRSQRQKTLFNQLIIDCYNANPSSMELALHSLAKHEGERMAILGDMFEMGEYEATEHQRIAQLALDLEIEEIVLVGKAFGRVDGDFTATVETTDELLEYLKDHQPKGKHILIKGSRGMTLEKAIELL